MYTGGGYDEYFLGDSCPPLSDQSSDDDEKMRDDDERNKGSVVEENGEDEHASMDGVDDDEIKGEKAEKDGDGGGDEGGDDETQPPEPLSLQPYGDFSCFFVPDSLGPDLEESFVSETQETETSNALVGKSTASSTADDEYYPIVEVMLCILIDGWKDMDPEKRRRTK